MVLTGRHFSPAQVLSQTGQTLRGPNVKPAESRKTNIDTDMETCYNRLCSRDTPWQRVLVAQGIERSAADAEAAGSIPAEDACPMKDDSHP